MSESKPNTVKVPMETVDTATGEVIKTEMVEMTIAPPPVGSCSVCGVQHDQREAHNAQSMFYQYRFYGAHGRWPTWADAVAHCEPEMRAKWIAELTRLKVWVTLPPDQAAIAEPYAMQRGGPEGKDGLTRDETVGPEVMALFQSLNRCLENMPVDVCEKATLNLFSSVLHNVARMRELDDASFALYARAMVESCYQNAAANWKRIAQPSDIPVRPH